MHSEEDAKGGCQNSAKDEMATNQADIFSANQTQPFTEGSLNCP